MYCPRFVRAHAGAGGVPHAPAPRGTSLIGRLGRFMKGAALLLGALVIAQPAGAQETGRITGTVTDSAGGGPLSNVQVTVAGTRLGSLTDASGRYSIGAVPAGTHTVETRRLGYRPSRRADVVVTAGGTTTADFALAANALVLQAVVTTGVVDPTAGTRTPFTVGRLEVADLPVPPTNAVEALQGKVAGVTIVPIGQPGSGTNIMLRTPTSINKSNAPLMVVDGVIQSQSFGASTADLEAMDIESMEVVKGAAAASLYGSRAASGVIQIRTRRGENLTTGVTQFSARTEVGLNQLAGSIPWARYHHYRTNAQGQYVDSIRTDSVLPRSRRQARRVYERFQDVPFAVPTFDQVDRFFDPGQYTNNSFNVAQNTGRTNWFLSFVNRREQGVVLESGEYRQNDVRLNLDHRPFDVLRLSFSGYHSRSDRNELYGDTFFDLINQPADVDLRTDASALDSADAVPYPYSPDTDAREENPLYVLATEESTRKRARTQGSIGARYEPLGWLSFDGNVSYDRSDRRNHFFLDQGIRTEGFSTAAGGPGEIEQTTGTTDALNAEASTNLIGQFGAATVRTTLRAVLERENNQVTEAEGDVLTVPGVRSLDNAQVRTVASTLQEIRSTGYFLSLGADYGGRYIIDGLIRRDGSSLFGPEERWNNYYRVSGAYRMAEEAWWPVPALTEFKLRASRGTAGNRPSFEDQYETYNFAPGGNLVKANLGNRFLKPETATETEIGVDAILHDRYSLQLSYARTKVVDQLVPIPLYAYLGYGTQWQNAGTVEGNTLEGTLEAHVIRRPDVNWRIGLVADRSRHKITEFDRSCFTTGTVSYRCEGENLGTMYGFRFLRSTSELQPAAQPRASEFAVNDEGLLVYVGPNNTWTEGQSKQLWGTNVTIGGTNYGWGLPIVLKDSIGNNQVVRIGNGNPDYRWGLSNSVNWRGLELYALVDAQVGGQNYNQTRQRMYQWARHGDVDQVGKDSVAKKPIEYYVSLYAANDPTDYFVEDASFLKVREMSVSYRLGGGALNAIRQFGVRGATVSIIGRNLFTRTNYRGYDPEVGNALVRLDSFDYPRYRTFTGSLQVNF